MFDAKQHNEDVVREAAARAREEAQMLRDSEDAAVAADEGYW